MMATSDQEHRAVFRKLLQEPAFQDLSDGAARMWLVLKLELGRLGIAHVGQYTLADARNASPDQCEAELQDLEEHGWIRREGRLIWMVNGLKNDPWTFRPNWQSRRSLKREAAKLPQTPMVRHFRAMYALRDADPDTLPDTVWHTLWDTVSDRVSGEPILEPETDTVSDTVSDTPPHILETGNRKQVEETTTSEDSSSNGQTELPDEFRTMPVSEFVAKIETVARKHRPDDLVEKGTEALLAHLEGLESDVDVLIETEDSFNVLLGFYGLYV